MSGSEEQQHLERLIVGNEDLERLEQLLGEFNLFEALGVVRQEVRHSDFLRFLLDPSENHGLGDTMLKALLKRALQRHQHPELGVIDIDVADLSESYAERERFAIDVLIHGDPAGIVIAIENKIGADEHSDQLRRYKESIRREYPSHKAVLLFLTPDGQDPSDPDWIALSYDDVLATTGSVSRARRSTLGGDVVTALTHYETMVRRHIVSESDVAELCRKLYRAHQKAFDLILEHRPDQQGDMREALERVIRSQPDFELDFCSKAFVRFFHRSWDQDQRLKTGTAWTRSGRLLLFELQNKPDSVRLKLIIGPGDPAVRERLFDFAKTHKDPFKGIPSKLYPMFTQVYSRPLVEKDDFDAPPEEVIQQAAAALTERFAGDIGQLIARVADFLRTSGLTRVS
ncbi:MAG: PD-(D/E)XK nuclease family protein [Deltaproteobacteria bacterium]|nr:PD-(D/E)XK nuclease family protein [Deltaproteobacteria bacterium]